MGSVDKPRELMKVAEGREAEMFAWGDGAILRLLRDPAAHARNQQQAAAMEAARSRGVRVPAVMEVTAVSGRPGLVMERIEGVDLLTLIGRRPWTLLTAARICGQVHASLHEVPAPRAIPPLREVLRRQIESAGGAAQDPDALSAATGMTGQRAEELRGLARTLVPVVLQTLDGLPDGDRLCHGDFHPANIMMDGTTPVLIDWTNVTRGDPAADVARTLMMLRLGEPPPGTSLTLRTLALAGRSLLIRLYLRSYRRRRPLEMELVRRWEVPVAAARLAEGITEEVPALLRFLERARGGWSP